MKLDKVRIIPYNSAYAKQTVDMWRKSKEQAIGQKEIHDFDNHVYFLNHILNRISFNGRRSVWNDCL